MTRRAIKYTEQIGDEICERLINGESLRRICLDRHMPSPALVCKWLADDANIAFREQYARAREAQADTLADEIVFISDTTEQGTITTTKPDGSVETKVSDMTEHRRLRIDARKWYAAKLAPKKYGDKLELGGALALSLPSDKVMSPDEWQAEAEG